ncbi:hypothetical protein C8R44DRAFT_610077 [Mycena epipterygia]|nr:hypothetical protein C8R44DRAFT_610077 [Mycena epipterygia]
MLAFSAVSAATPVIVLPAKGSVIAPNSTFNFTYHSIAEYGTSSYAFTVWLFTSFKPSETFATGHYFGRFSQPNYPANIYPHNLPPATFEMPDFSKLEGGWGVGSPATHATFYFAVIEEYGNGQASLSCPVDDLC